jgi:hypothetical protein
MSETHFALPMLHTSAVLVSAMHPLIRVLLILLVYSSALLGKYFEPLHNVNQEDKRECSADAERPKSHRDLGSESPEKL